MKRVRIKAEEMKSIEIHLPVIFKVDGEDYTGILKGCIDGYSCKKVEKC